MPTWTDAQLASIHKMLNPRSIAVVGATPRLQYGGRMLAAALSAKDRVNVYPVNPRYDEIMDIKCYPSVADLPEAPDMVGIVVPYERVRRTPGKPSKGCRFRHRYLRRVRRAWRQRAPGPTGAAGRVRPGIGASSLRTQLLGCR